MRRILIVRLSSLGDVVLTMPVVTALRNAYPQAIIYYLTTDAYKDIIQMHADIDQIVTIDSYHGWKWFSSFCKVVRYFRREKIDLFVDLHFRTWSYFHAALWLFLVYRFLKVGKRVKAWRPIFRLQRAHRKNKEHVLDWYWKCLVSIGVHPVSPEGILQVSAEDYAWARSYLRDHWRGRAFVAIAPGASWPSKQWGRENFRDVCGYWNASSGEGVILFGAEKDRLLIESITASLPGHIFMAAVGFPLRKVAALLSCCRVLITNDSGLMHLAAFLRIQVVALFGPTHPCLGYTPLGTHVNVVHADVACSPCSRWGEKECNRRTRVCFDRILPQQVISLAKGSLELIQA